ncbi:MAG: hypothetical protein JNL06_16195 [Alphaproteobacteria bacterium]|nr:hypothetical protein [Alphaproteobacteria bacterium]
MTKIKVLAWVHIVLSGFLLGLGLLICLVMLISPDKDSRAPAMILPMFFTMAAFLLIPAFVGGIGLLYLQWWARVLIIILSLMHVMLFPIGTLLGGFGLWVLFSHDAQAAFGDKAIAAQAARVAQGGGALPPGMIGLLIAIAAVGAGFIVVIGAGFLISGDAAPVELMSAFYPAVGVLALCLAYGVYVLIHNPPRFGSGVGLPSVGGRSGRDFPAEQRARLAQLRANPATVKFAAAIEAGEAWSDEQIAYDLDPSAVATCEHLEPIERAMRASHIAVKRWRPLVVQAQCRIDEAALKRMFPSANYAEPQQYDRSLEDPPGALLSCSDCTSRILVVHPSVAGAGTPAFPAQAAAAAGA